MEHEDRFCAPKNKARLGLAHEMRGDISLFAGIHGHQDEYTQASEIYKTVDSDKGWQADDEFSIIIKPVIELAASTNYEIDVETKDRIERTSLEARTRFKDDTLDSILDRVLDQGGWESDIF
jgi:hypothetical protein